MFSKLYIFSKLGTQDLVTRSTISSLLGVRKSTLGLAISANRLAIPQITGGRPLHAPHTMFSPEGVLLSDLR